MDEQQKKTKYIKSDPQGERIQYSKKKLEEKNKNYTPTDRSKEYLVCYHCIKFGYPNNFRGQAVLCKK